MSHLENKYFVLDENVNEDQMVGHFPFPNFAGVPIVLPRKTDVCLYKSFFLCSFHNLI
jgi:hypothetical protein